MHHSTDKTTHKLIDEIGALPPFKESSWQDQLEFRKIEEFELHNFARDHTQGDLRRKKNFDANKKFYSVNQSSRAYVLELLVKNCKKAIFLDYACGDGDMTIFCARHDALLSIGIDISDTSIRNAMEKVSRDEMLKTKCFFFQGDCEFTELPTESVGLVLCSGTLHHLDLHKAYSELARILMPGGKIVAVEALAHNPIFQFYRDMTPDLRTEWEKAHILKNKDILLAQKYGLEIVETRYWHLLVMLVVPLRGTVLFQALRKILDGIDKIILKLPLIRNLAWQVTFILEKTSSGAGQLERLRNLPKEQA